MGPCDFENVPASEIHPNDLWWSTELDTKKRVKDSRRSFPSSLYSVSDHGCHSDLGGVGQTDTFIFVVSGVVVGNVLCVLSGMCCALWRGLVCGEQS